MKAIYIKPEMEVVNLQVEEDIAWGKKGFWSVDENHTGNTGFFDDEENKDGKANFFDD